MKNLIILECKKNISKDIDLSSTLNLIVDKVKVKLKSSLTEKLNDDLTIYTSDQIIRVNGIFNISSNSYIAHQNEDGFQKIRNTNYKNSYFYEIKEITNTILNHTSLKKKANNSFNKIENNIKLLSKWYTY